MGGMRGIRFFRRVARALLLAALTAGSLPAREPGGDPALEEAARRLVPGAAMERRRFDLDGAPFESLLLPDVRGIPTGFVFRTAPLAPGIEGFAGPIDLAAAVTADGVLLGATILASRETPWYAKRVESWLASLSGRRLFGEPDILEVEALSGATLSSEAARDSLHVSGQAFAGRILGEIAERPRRAPSRRLPPAALILAALAAAALRFSRAPSRLLRRVWLLAVVAGFGFAWNTQVSLEFILRLVRRDGPSPALSAAFLLTFGAPLLAWLAGNLVCGWLCPFGALQELAGDWRRGRAHYDPDPPEWSRLRRGKYLLLAAALLAAAFGRADPAAALDPLGFAFGRERSAPMFPLAVALLILSVFFGRFWCRNLCPTGAFFSLLGRLTPWRRRLPRVLPGRCDYGVAGLGDLDCLVCDRCRQAGAAPPAGSFPARTRLRLLAAAVGLALAAWFTLGRLALRF